MTMPSTNLPPAVIAGLYKQIVIPAGEAAALAELAEAHGVTAKVAGSGPVRSAEVAEAEGSNPVHPTRQREEIPAKQSVGGTGLDDGQAAAAVAPKTAASEGTTGKDVSAKPAAPVTTADLDAKDASTKVATPISGAVERPVQASAEPAKELQPLSALADEAAANPLIAGSNPFSSADTPASSYKFLGKNLKHIVVIVRSPKEPFLPEDHLQFLTKMLGACQLNLGDVAIVNDATRKADIQLLKAQLQPARMLLFGVAPAEIGLPLTFPQFKEQEYAGCSYLYSPSLLDLNRTSEEAKDLKRKLWECLKKMFNV